MLIDNGALIRDDIVIIMHSRLARPIGDRPGHQVIPRSTLPLF